MPKTSRTSRTTSARPGRLSSRFWQLLGASTEKDQSRSLAEVRASSEFDEKAAGLDDDQLQKAAGLLKLDDLADSADISQYLAIAREAAERSTELRPFDVQLLGALRMLAGDVIEMATGEGKTLAGAIAAAGYVLAGRH
ncbi:MAG: accessory Sec system translocase SecA2, partial [Mycobacterium sp.]|nr:accessory Sec system translocase SecA2 [Mycobacterium sp.]